MQALTQMRARNLFNRFPGPNVRKKEDWGVFISEYVKKIQEKTISGGFGLDLS